VLVVVEDWDVHLLSQALFDVKAIGRLDILQIDAAEGRLERADDAHYLIGIARVQLYVKHINVCESFEKYSLPFHNRLARQRSDITQAQNCRSIRYHGDEIAPCGVVEDIIRAFFNLPANLRHSRRVSEAEVPLGRARFCQPYFQLSTASLRMVIECVLLS